MPAMRIYKKKVVTAFWAGTTIATGYECVESAQTQAFSTMALDLITASILPRLQRQKKYQFSSRMHYSLKLNWIYLTYSPIDNFTRSFLRSVHHKYILVDTCKSLWEQKSIKVIPMILNEPSGWTSPISPVIIHRFPSSSKKSVLSLSL